VLITVLVVSALVLHPSSSSSIITTSIGVTIAHAKEIVATNEWQLLTENDTLPAGLHVRIDLTTGQKWAKNIDDSTAEEYQYDSTVEDVDAVEGVIADGSISSHDGGTVDEGVTKKKSLWNKVKSFFKRGLNKTNSTSKVNVETTTAVGEDDDVAMPLSSTTTTTTTTSATDTVPNYKVSDDIIKNAAREKRKRPICPITICVYCN
jgi:hypothetical protein